MDTTAVDFLSTAASQNMTSSDNCRRLQFVGHAPWDHPEKIFTTENEAFFERLKGAIVLPFLFLIGGPANVINMAVFFKQGLKERINLCLFALAAVDGLYLLVCVLQNAERMYTQFAAPGERNGPALAFIVNHNLIGFFGFSWVSQIYTAIIASERCFCVVSPLRSHTVLSTRTMAVILALVVVIIVGLFFLVATRFRMICVYDPVTNARFNVLDGGEFYYRNQKFIDYLDSLVYGFALPGASILVVLVTTTVTIVKLRKAMAWRSETSGTLSTREVALTKMLVAVSILFLACVTPLLLFRAIALFIPGMRPGGRYHNLYLSLLWIMEIPTYVNSSFNIFVYYSMGSRYRDTVRLILCRRGNKDRGVEKPKAETG
ncbi:hypothetical protein ACOMHN_023960 [Nucella lapillus]